MSEPNSINITIHFDKEVNFNGTGYTGISIDKLLDAAGKFLSSINSQQSADEQPVVSETDSEPREIYKFVAPGVNACHLISVLHSLMDIHQDPKNKLKPLRAAYEAAYFTSAIPWMLFCREFGVVSKGSYSRWMRLKNCYDQEEISLLITELNQQLNGK